MKRTTQLLMAALLNFTFISGANASEKIISEKKMLRILESQDMVKAARKEIRKNMGKQRDCSGLQIEELTESKFIVSESCTYTGDDCGSTNFLRMEGTIYSEKYIRFDNILFDGAG